VVDPIRIAGVVAALSVTSDLARGHPPGEAMRACLLATELGRELNVPLRIASLVHGELTEALNRGWAERDSRIFMLLQEERAGVNIAVPADKIQEALARG